MYYNVHMKIYCEKCHADITVQCDSLFEKNTVGSVQCPECRKIQSRYISEGDLLLYFALSETSYIIFSFVPLFVFRTIGIGFISVAVIMASLVLALMCQKMISRKVYVNAYNKKELMNTKFKEDAEAIKKNLNWQFLLFTVIAFTAFTNEDMQMFFIGIMFLANIATYIKYYLQLKREREAK